ncbi:MAG: Bax inhibitor-1/YccA family protein [Alphaproteobacteria bacterium]|nr:Bax inhibitor-1/YccA family protein [Alphaproteobacteria bacterium]
MTNNPFNRGADSAGIERVGIDSGLRSHMLRIYNYMGLGVGVTGLVSWLIANTPAINALFFDALTHRPTVLGMIAAFAPLAFVLFIGFASQRSSASTLQGMFWLFCAVMGVSLASIFMYFTDESIARTFFVVAGMFAGTSLWGYTTKSDLSKMGSFMMMGLIGIIIAGIVNMFVHSSMLQFITSILGVVIFVGLTAWDTQRIKDTYSESFGAEANDKMAIFGALNLYMNFINLFQFMLQFMGSRRD